MKHDFFRRVAWRGYVLALVCWGVAFAVRFGLADSFPPGFPYLTFFPAVVLVTYFAGLRPAILTATLSGLTAWWFWIGPQGFDLSGDTLVAVTFYIFVVAIDIFFIVGMDGASRRLAREVARNAALAESRDILLREVQHRVSNNIQVVSALLSLEARATDDLSARKVLLDACARTALVARIQRSLAEAERQATAFEDLARLIVDDAIAAAAREDVKVSIISGDVALSAEEATPVVLIMLECVNNALEHAFPDRAGTLTIELCDDGSVRTLVITDDGVGVREAVDSVHQSLGLKIISALAKQLGGQWSLQSTNPGTCARLCWPSEGLAHEA
ncbi:sensor histidine kinase [Brevundimonas pishanensis]|uniref:sensor histidine kinase n=1 Tax=Brevundimonas pishanensis TaxID=2896315 RepID=UPI001FA73473|nr:histidine kinase dimerization/phosphoacceptor domain -containing protein [Brevundimonas pishanensis]